MKTLAAVALLLIPTPQLRQPDPCELQANAAWNRFAKIANKYNQERDAGVHDAKARAQLLPSLQAALNCECF